MNTYINKKTIIVFCGAILCILLIWLSGLGFGNEIRLSELLGIKFLGSALYLGTWFTMIAMAVVGFGIPFLIIHFVFKEKIQDYGFSLGDIKTGLIWLMILLPASVLGPLVSAYIGTDNYYTYLKDPNFLKPLHIAIHSVSYLALAFGFEFLFRGFVLFGLNQGMGNTKTSKWIAAFLSGVLAVFCLFSLPWTFAAAAFLSSIAAGFLNFKTRSFIYLALMHWSTGI